MASSFSIKVGADTTEFNKSLRAADGQIRTTTRLGDALTKTLEHKYDAKTAEQAQKQFQKALADTQVKAEALRKQMEHMETAGKVDTNQYRKLETDLAKATLEAANLEKKLEDVDKMKLDNVVKGFKDVGDAIENAGKKLAPFSAAAGGMIAAAGAIAKKASDLGGDIDEMSERFEVSSDTIQRWNYLSIQSGVETNTFSRALIRMRAAMADIAQGTSNKATDVLQSLGISPEQFASSEEMFDGIVAALRRVEDGTLQTAYANEIFGDRIANDMLPYIKIADETLKQYNAEFDAMPTLTQAQVTELDVLSDSFTRLTTTMEYSTAQLGVAFTPIMERLIIFIEETAVPAIERLAEWFDNLSPSSQNAVVGALAIIAVLAPLLIIIGKVATGVGALIKVLAALKAATLLTAAGFAALGGAMVLGLDIIFNWKEMSTVEKILKSLAVAALVAAAAITVFQASWSLGIAVGAIAAGVVAGIAAIKAASDDIGVDAGIGSEDAIMRSANASSDFDFDATEYADQSEVIRNQSAGGSHTYNAADYSKTDQSTNTFNIYVDSNEYASADEIVEIVSKRIATISSARG